MTNPTIHTFRVIRINNITGQVSPRDYDAATLEEAIAMAEEATKGTLLSVAYRADGSAFAGRLDFLACAK